MELTGTSPRIPDHSGTNGTGRLQTRQLTMFFANLLAGIRGQLYGAKLQVSRRLGKVQGVCHIFRTLTVKNVPTVPRPAWTAFVALTLVSLVPIFLHHSASVQTLASAPPQSGFPVPAEAADPPLGDERAVTLYVVTAGVEPRHGRTVVQIMDDSGHEVWRGPATATEHNWHIHPARAFGKGRYRIRVFDSRQPELVLRDYTFVVR